MYGIDKKIPFSHFWMSRAGAVYDWLGSDNQEVYNRHLKEKYQELETAGWHDLTRKIQYRMNQDGFRGDEIDTREAGMAIGCSLVMGVGVPEESSWPHQLAQKLGIHIWNFGVAGAGNDVCFRVIDHYLEIIRPRFVIYQMPSLYRHEFFVDSRWRQTMVSHIGDISQDYVPYIKNWFANDENIIAQGRRNLLAIKYRCHETNTPLFITQHPMRMDRKGRDLMHPGIESMTEFADYIYDQRHHYLGGAS